MSDQDRIRRLEESVRDERARRVYAEQELAAERDRVEIWRRRAEERSEALRQARPGQRRRRWWSRSSSPPAPASAPPSAGPTTSVRHEPERERPAICHPTLRVGVWKAPEWFHSAADVFSVQDHPESLAWADLVVVGSAGARDMLEEWAGWEARPPLVLWEPTQQVIAEWKTLLARRDVVAGGESRPEAGIAVATIPVAPDPDPSPEQDWVEVSGDVPLDRIVALAADRPLRWASARPPGPELDGLVATGDEADRRKQTIRARLALKGRYGPGAALERVAAAAGLDLPPWEPEVGLLAVTRRPERVPALLERVAALRYPRFRLVLGLHGVGEFAEMEDLVERAQIGDRTSVLWFDPSWPLGRCLNQAAESVGSAVLAKIDDDDLYGPWYLDEAVDELRETGADLVGKVSQYVHLVDSDRLVLYQPGTENTEVGYVNGPTFVMPRATWERVRFPHRAARVDSTFVRGLRAAAGTIRASSRFEFVLGRYGSGHTWETSDEHFLARGEVVGPGSDLSVAWLDT